MAELPQTDWSMLGRIAGGEDAAQREAALEKLVRRYWPAIYAYIRRSGRDVHAASDLTQGFITTVILERRLAEKAKQSRGRFRSFLLKSLQNYLRERHRYESRRRPKEATERSRAALNPFEIDAAEGRDFDTPEAAFSYHWSASMVRRVLETVRLGCLAAGLEAHWRVFDARVARPLLQGEPAPDLATLVERFEIEDAATASNMIITVKRRFAKTLREEIRLTVGDEADVESELADLIRNLGR